MMMDGFDDIRASDWIYGCVSNIDQLMMNNCSTNYTNHSAFTSLINTDNNYRALSEPSTMANICNYDNYANHYGSAPVINTDNSSANHFLLGSVDNTETYKVSDHYTNHPASASIVNPDSTYTQQIAICDCHTKYTNQSLAQAHNHAENCSSNYMTASSINSANQNQVLVNILSDSRTDNNTALNYPDKSASAPPINSNYTYPTASASPITTNHEINGNYINTVNYGSAPAPLLQTSSCSLSTSSISNNDSHELQHNNQRHNQYSVAANYTSPEHNSNQNRQMQGADAAANKLISDVDNNLYLELHSLISPPAEITSAHNSSIAHHSHFTASDQHYNHTTSNSNHHNANDVATRIASPYSNDHNLQSETPNFLQQSENPNTNCVQTAIAAVHPSSVSIHGKIKNSGGAFLSSTSNTSSMAKLHRDKQVSKTAIATKTQNKHSTAAKQSRTTKSNKRSFTISFNRNPNDTEIVDDYNDSTTITSLADAGVDESTLIAIAGSGITVDYGSVAKKTKLDAQSLSRHCEAERKRRHKLNQSLQHLRALVSPTLSDKTDKASIIEAAVRLLMEKHEVPRSTVTENTELRQASCKLEVDEGRASCSMNDSPDCSTVDDQSQQLGLGDCAVLPDSSPSQIRCFTLSEVFCDLSRLGEVVQEDETAAADNGQWRPKVSVRESSTRKGHHIISVRANDKSGMFTSIIRALDNLNLKIVFANSYCSRTHLDCHRFISKVAHRLKLLTSHQE